MEVSQMNRRLAKRTKYMQAFGAVVALAEAERQFRDVKSLVDRTLGTAQKFWLAVPVLAAGWAYMVSDDDRFALLERVADEVLNRVSLEPVERWLAS
jgi:hypothetical protein